VIVRKLPKKNAGVRDAMKLSVCLYGASCAKGEWLALDPIMTMKMSILEKDDRSNEPMP